MVLLITCITVLIVGQRNDMCGVRMTNYCMRIYEITDQQHKTAREQYSLAI